RLPISAKERSSIITDGLSRANEWLIAIAAPVHYRQSSRQHTVHVYLELSMTADYCGVCQIMPTALLCFYILAHVFEYRQ
ncbi:MAG: hypothetical protein FWE68_02515, partial [Defluviitaleaceae bacterium]|nr:hypothetical protein [Defluviitaleaceae bacterium]